MAKKIVILLSLFIALFITGIGVSWVYLKSLTVTKVEEVVKVTTPSSILEDTKQTPATAPEVYQAAPAVCEVTFTLTSSPTPIPTPIIGCYEACSIGTEGASNCPTNLACKSVNGTYKCVNNSCPTISTCVCTTPVPTPTPSTTPVPTPTPSSTPGPTPTPLPGCYGQCNTDNNCQGSLVCRSVGGTNRCVNINCTGESDCSCETTTPKEPEAPKAPNAPNPPELPVAGGIPPTIIFALGGIVIVLLGLLF